MFFINMFCIFGIDKVKVILGFVEGKFFFVFLLFNRNKRSL